MGKSAFESCRTVVVHTAVVVVAVAATTANRIITIIVVVIIIIEIGKRLVVEAVAIIAFKEAWIAAAIVSAFGGGEVSDWKKKKDSFKK